MFLNIYIKYNITCRFLTETLEELIKHGLRALRDTLPNEVDLTNKVLNSVYDTITKPFENILPK